MKKILKWLTAYLFAAVVAFAGMTAFADTVTAVVLETNPGTVIPAETPDGALPKIGAAKTNTLRVTFSGGTAQYASLTVVPAENGIALPVTKENVVLMQQQYITNGAATFRFLFKESLPDGVYALYAGGTDAESEVRYFAVSTRFAPELKGGETFQYDDYKNSIVLGFDVKENVNFADWAKQKDAMKVTLRTGGNTAEVSPADITLDESEKTICIQMQNYRKILPTLDTVMDGNMQTAEIEIVTPGYWANEELGGAQRGSFTLMTPKVSAEGFSSGVDFEIELYAD